jgi:hypothetical protein
MTNQLSADRGVITLCPHVLQVAREMAHLKARQDFLLDGFGLAKILSFISMASALKNDILLVQPPSVSLACAPGVLPPAISHFLAEALGLSAETTKLFWDTLKDEVWRYPEAGEDIVDLERAFRDHGWKRGLTSLTLYPPSQICTNPSCVRAGPLKKDEHRQAVVYTLAGGVRPAWSVHLKCQDCSTNYHHNFAVSNGVRTYYGGIPKYVQVGEHQFVENAVIKMWISMMLVGWFSASNCALSYDMALSQQEEADIARGGWQFGTTLTTEHVWDAFVIFTLLQDHTARTLRMQVPHTGAQRDRFTALMEERNQYVILYGQEEVPHTCDKCLRIIKQADGSCHKCQVILSDGLTLGHPCCGVFRCTEPLLNNKHRYCATHAHQNTLCAVVDCNNSIVVGTKSCSRPDHQEMERLYLEKGKSIRTLEHRLKQHRGGGNPNNTLPSADDPNPDDDLDEIERWYEVDKSGVVQMHSSKTTGSVGVRDDVPCEAKKSETGNTKIKTQYGRRRTHNEQTLVRPCGVIFARATFFGAEAVSNVLHFVKNAFSVPGAYKPEHLVYDTNCDAKQQVMKSGDPFFADMGMCVDVWHFLNKHKATHDFCQEHCNPADYPELKGPDGKWFFNTSVAEQTNVWLGGYHSICREMLPVKYNFFLDEMICLRNQQIVAKLKKDGHRPRHAPHPSAK